MKLIFTGGLEESQKSLAVELPENAKLEEIDEVVKKAQSVIRENIMELCPAFEKQRKTYLESITEDEKEKILKQEHLSDFDKLDFGLKYFLVEDLRK